MKHWKYAGLLLCALTAISIAGCKKEKAQGRPESFKNTTLPPLSELSKYIAMQPAVPTPFWRFTVRAHQFGEHDYPDVRAGIPVSFGGNVCRGTERVFYAGKAV